MPGGAAAGKVKVAVIGIIVTVTVVIAMNQVEEMILDNFFDVTDVEAFARLERTLL